jgi:hypothetical protein
VLGDLRFVIKNRDIAGHPMDVVDLKLDATHFLNVWAILRGTESPWRRIQRRPDAVDCIVVVDCVSQHYVKARYFNPIFHT